MTSYSTVFFDWSGTLASDPGLLARIRFGHCKLGRLVDENDVTALADRFNAIWSLPEVVAASHDEDISKERHKCIYFTLFERSGFDEELAEAVYGFDEYPENRPPFEDAAPLLEALKAAGLKLSIISDIHVDLRVHMSAHGMGDLIDDYVLSYEQGIQKPDLEMFAIALKRLEADPATSLMVGDRASKDGAAAEVGIATLILAGPPPHDTRSRGLDAVRRLVAG